MPRKYPAAQHTISYSQNGGRHIEKMTRLASWTRKTSDCLVYGSKQIVYLSHNCFTFLLSFPKFGQMIHSCKKKRILAIYESNFRNIFQNYVNNLLKAAKLTSWDEHFGAFLAAAHNRLYFHLFDQMIHCLSNRHWTQLEEKSLSWGPTLKEFLLWTFVNYV